MSTNYLTGVLEEELTEDSFFSKSPNDEKQSFPVQFNFIYIKHHNSHLKMFYIVTIKSFFLFHIRKKEKSPKPT